MFLVTGFGLKKILDTGYWIKDIAGCLLLVAGCRMEKDPGCLMLDTG
jgi:hypothetical protein